MLHLFLGGLTLRALPLTFIESQHSRLRTSYKYCFLKISHWISSLAYGDISVRSIFFCAF